MAMGDSHHEARLQDVPCPTSPFRKGEGESLGGERSLPELVTSWFAYVLTLIIFGFKTVRQTETSHVLKKFA
jgi:hypothetical protein